MGSTDPGPQGSGLSREARLLLATAGGPSQDNAIQRLATGGLDWAHFLTLVVQERAEAIVAPRLDRLQVPPPEAERRSLLALATRSNLRMATLGHRLDQTLAAFAGAGVPAILLKGAALGRTVYGSVARRPMLDIDVLVPAAQAQDAFRVAQAAGWVIRAGDAEAFRDHFHLVPLEDQSGVGFSLEIHTGLFFEGHPFRWPLEDFWERSHLTTDGLARVPSPEDLLLHTLLHFSWSHMGRAGPWRTFRDVRVLAESQTVDWNRFVLLVKSARGMAPAYWTLRLARLAGIVEVPGFVEAELRPAAPRFRGMLGRHFAGLWFPTGAPCPSIRVEQILWRIAMGELGRSSGAALPWAREPAFLSAQLAPESERLTAKILRHLTGLGAYGRYFRRVALGRVH